MDVPQDVRDCMELIRQWEESRDRQIVPYRRRRRRRSPDRGGRNVRPRVNCDELRNALDRERQRGEAANRAAEQAQRVFDAARQRRMASDLRRAELQEQYDQDCDENGQQRIRRIGLDVNNDGLVDLQAEILPRRELRWLDNPFFVGTGPVGRNQIRLRSGRIVNRRNLAE